MICPGCATFLRYPLSTGGEDEHTTRPFFWNLTVTFTWESVICCNAHSQNCSMVGFGLVWFGLVGLDWVGWPFGLGWVGLGLVGLGWFGLSWLGLGRIGWSWVGVR